MLVWFDASELQREVGGVISNLIPLGRHRKFRLRLISEKVKYKALVATGY